MRVLVAIPVYNEQAHVRTVLDRVLAHVPNVLVVDDGSTDDTARILAEYRIDSVRHARNRGYGRSLRDAFRWAMVERYDWIITMDCDDQHEPERIPDFLGAAARDDLDLISGSRYLRRSSRSERAPADRRAINREMTCEINRRFGLELTDSFCGFKAHRVAALRDLRLTVNGYAFPMQLWTQSVAAGHRIGEIPVDLIYNDLSRSFGARLDDPKVRLRHYRTVLQREIRRCADRLPETAPTPGCAEYCGDCSSPRNSPR